MNYYKTMDNLDASLNNLSTQSEILFGKIISAIQWSWDKMTLLSVLIIVMILAIIGLAWLQISDRKKFASRAYWRGYFCGIKQNNTNNTKEDKVRGGYKDEKR